MKAQQTQFKGMPFSVVKRYKAANAAKSPVPARVVWETPDLLTWNDSGKHRSAADLGELPFLVKPGRRVARTFVQAGTKWGKRVVRTTRQNILVLTCPQCGLKVETLLEGTEQYDCSCGFAGRVPGRF